MSDICLSQQITLGDITAHFREIFPTIAIDFRDLQNPDSWHACDITVSIDENLSEFPCGLCVGARVIDRSIGEIWLRELARTLSIRLQCQVWYGGGFGEYDSETHCIVWISGEAFLADDHDSLLFGGDGGAVKILHPLPELADDIHRINLVKSIHRTVN